MQNIHFQNVICRKHGFATCKKENHYPQLSEIWLEDGFVQIEIYSVLALGIAVAKMSVS